MASPEGLEPPTSDLEGRCSIQLSYGLVEGRRLGERVVGAAGFELATYWSQTSCATRLRYAPNPRIVLRAPRWPPLRAASAASTPRSAVEYVVLRRMRSNV